MKVCAFSPLRDEAAQRWGTPGRAYGRLEQQIPFGNDGKKSKTGWFGFVLSHPFANSAKGWGTRQSSVAVTFVVPRSQKRDLGHPALSFMRGQRFEVAVGDASMGR